jgi:hypothetical protein
MSDADWPSPEPSSREPAPRPSPLPRVEDLPIAEQGYDREKVQEAFDAFYRHAAQLDATLRTLESVDVFQRTAAELRAELRTIRGSGLSVGSWQSGAGAGYGTRSPIAEWSLPPAAPRIGAEALFLIVVGVIVGIAGWPRLTIVLVMALALGIVWLVEWVASRERAIPRAAAPAQAPALDEPAELEAAPAPAEPQQEGPEAMTILGEPVREPEPAPEEPVPGDSPSEPALEAVAEPDVIPEDTAEEFILLDQAEPEVVDEPEADLPDAGPPDEPALEVVAGPDALVEDAAEELAARADDEPQPDEEREVGEPQQPDEPEEEREDDLVAVAEELERAPEPEELLAGVEPLETHAERRRFRLFRRRAAEPPGAENVVAEHVPGEPLEPVPGSGEPSVMPGPDLEPPLIEPEESDEPDEPDEPDQRLDPWEQAGADLQPELEEPDRRVDGWGQTAAVPEPELEEPAVEPPPRHSWFRREPAPTLVETEPEEEELEPVAQLEPDPEPEEPEAEPEEPGELPVEALAEQAAAALERSRARRRTPRRARRR